MVVNSREIVEKIKCEKLSIKIVFITNEAIGEISLFIKELNGVT